MKIDFDFVVITVCDIFENAMVISALLLFGAYTIQDFQVSGGLGVVAFVVTVFIVGTMIWLFQFANKALEERAAERMATHQARREQGNK